MTFKQDQFVHVLGVDISQAIAVSPVIGKRMVPPFDSFDEWPFGIVEDHELKIGIPEVHTDDEDLWICIEGEAIFTLGGELIEPSFGKLQNGAENPKEIKGKNIVGGKEIVIGRGDILWIPAGIPHMHTAPGTARLFIYKNPKRL